MGNRRKIIMGENLIYDASVKVGSHHYARLFAKDYDVLWLSLPWNIFLFFKYGLKGERIQQWNKGRIKKVDGICVWAPFTFFPYRDNMFFRGEKMAYRTLKYTMPRLKKLLSKSDFLECDILWITDPRMIYLTEIIKYKKLVYRCVDDLRHFSGIPQNITSIEEKLVNKSDVVFATAGTLKKRLESFGKKVYDLPNAVDFDFFYRYQTEGKSCTLDKYKNVILYVGTIGEWFDCEFVLYCAQKRPFYNFVIAGPIRTNIDSINNLNNIHIVGPIPYEKVPLFMKKSQVGLIPFKKNDLVNAVNPLKMYEYFASGLPVVATESHELKNMNSPALLYRSYAEGIALIDSALSESKDLISQYVDFAMNHSWKKRYKYILNIVENLE